MGQGMVVVTPEPERFIQVAQGHDVESKIIGKVTEKKGIRVRNLGYHKDEDTLEFSD
jgi:phosphoribosylaminoimidazole (AIR) synthetase